MSDRSRQRGWAPPFAALTAVIFVMAAGCAATATPEEPASVPLAEAKERPSTAGGSRAEEAGGIDRIEGYGDFSDQDPVYLDWRLVNERVGECMRDQGFPVSVTAGGNGLSFADVPSEQSAMAESVFDACVAGLNVPPQRPLTADEMSLFYAYYVELRGCLVGQGYELPEPPSEQYFIDHYYDDPWNPYSGIERIPPELTRVCPQLPTGGWGAWQPGDPVSPLTPGQTDG